jgi:hypothetical protein
MIQSHVSLIRAWEVVANYLANYRVIDSNAVAIVVERGKLAELSRVNLSDTHFCGLIDKRGGDTRRKQRSSLV